jgi:flagellar biosynthetic protein FlhB
MFAQSIESLTSAGHLLSFSFLASFRRCADRCRRRAFPDLAIPRQAQDERQEVKQEGKELEGNPEVKGRIRQLQREAARKRMMAAVPAADVIVTNPGHYAVALAYKSGMGAPKVLAKGMGEVALKIRKIGRRERGAHGRSSTAGARALSPRRTRPGDPCGPLRGGRRGAGLRLSAEQLAPEGGVYPLPPRDIAGPDELVPEVARMASAPGRSCCRISSPVSGSGSWPVRC